jgi:hypothetical protein
MGVINVIFDTEAPEIGFEHRIGRPTSSMGRVLVCLLRKRDSEGNYVT